MSRLTFQRMLGAIWLFDGLLQFKPKMFTQGFLRVNVLTAIAGQPLWLAHLLHWEILIMSHPEWLFNLGIAVIQTSLGVLLLFNRHPRSALAMSIAWALAVWVFGEALGNLMQGQWSIVNGAPGAAVLYAIMAVVVWPLADQDDRWQPYAHRVAIITLVLGGLFTMVSLWTSPMQSVSLSVTGARALSILLAASIVGLITPARQWSALAIFGLSMTAWILLQHIGYIWLAYATDINSGGLWALMALSLAPEIGFRLGRSANRARGTRSESKTHYAFHNRIG